MSATDKVSFTRMDAGTREDYALIEEHEAAYKADLPRRLMERLRAMGEGLSGYQVSRLEHSLQTATRARREGADADWVVAALLHDLGDELAPQNHDTLAASIIAPYVREECTWAVRHHGIFQFKYYGDKVGLDPDAREKYRANPHYAATVHFCEAWDQTSFDPAYASDDPESFAPELEQVFLRPAWDEAYLRPGFVTQFA
ncbi:HD domain-containing protein [Altererythrobacter arenosus]|uniref:HD domain-containing protein n=1 Tax=Altererythrobacter arenosus TaxID=3032592 RepID=A0ABY8FR64_9SPHN|nr:HD domain-containing protein [Altererythrobacter sp. CAU 1644]WFL77342.1 HD domain-containing protein [Altererythrobacter sp. CAU 1644]